MSHIVSVEEGDSSIQAPVATSTPSPTSSAQAKPPTAPPAPARTTSPIDVIPVAAPTPAPEPTNAPADTDPPVAPPPPPPPPPPPAAGSPKATSPRQNPAPPKASSTIIPSIAISPVPKNAPQASPSSPRPSPSVPLNPTPLVSSKGSEPSESTAGIILPPVVPSNSKGSSSSSVPTGNPNGSPFEAPKGGSQSAAPATGKKTGSTVAGVVGGLSAAVLLGIVLFFVWKWKTRGRYRFNKRTSFGPYGNGIDANRAGLLVSAVPPKSGDSVSANESMYEKDEPNRYRRPSEDLLNRQPTLPRVGGSPERSYAIPQPPRTATFDMREPKQSYRPDAAMLAMHPAMRPQQARPTGVFYERRKLPPPPSMRRNPAPPLIRHNRSYSAGSVDGHASLEQAGHGVQPAAPAPAPAGVTNGPVRRGNSPPNWSNQSNGEHEPPPRSYTLGGQISRPPPGSAPMVPASQRRVRRSMSLGGMSTRYRNPFLDPLSMHPIIQEVPSGQNSPMNEKATMNFQSFPESLKPGAGPATSGGQVVRDRPSPVLWNRPDSSNRVLTVRNIPSPSPPEAASEKAQTPLNNMMSRMGSMRDHNGFRVQDAAKNF